MSEFHVNLTHVRNIQKHPNADTLSTGVVFGSYPVIFRTGDVDEIDPIIYIPEDSIVPSQPRYEFLGGHNRIKAKKLRGIFSMGLVLPLMEFLVELGDVPGIVEDETDLQDILGITHYEPVDTNLGQQRQSPEGSVKCTDMESLRRYGNIFSDDDYVVVTEKIDGANFRAFYRDGELFVGTHNTWQKENDGKFWDAARRHNLAEQLGEYPNKIFFGELYGFSSRFGQIQKFEYDTVNEHKLRFYDVFDIETGRYLDCMDAFTRINELGLMCVPVLAAGFRWTPDYIKLADGRSTLNKNHIREGVVIKTATEQFDPRIGRKILKFHSEAYLLQK
jgi:RNA ligase (TIGR02306 family)